MTPRNILITGMGRTASTVLYNAARLALMEKDSTYATVDTKYDPYNPAVYHVVKGHQYAGWEHFAGWADVVFTFRRDLRDVVASYKRKDATFRKRLPHGKLWEPDHMHLGDLAVEWHERWGEHSNHEWVYEEYLQDPYEYIRMFLGWIECTLSEETYEYVYNLPTFEAGEPDPDSLMGPEHITDGRVGSFEDTLTPTEKETILERHGAWLKEYGYV